MQLHYFEGNNRFLEVDGRFKTCISEGIALLITTGLAVADQRPDRQQQKELLERIRLLGMRLTEVILKSRGDQDLHLFARPLYKRLNSTLGFLNTLREAWMEHKDEAGTGRPFDLEFCIALEATLTRKRDLLTNHIPSYLYTPFFNVETLKNALLLADSYTKVESDGEVIIARRLAYVFADLELRKLLWKIPRELLVGYVRIYVDCSEDYIMKNLERIKDDFKGDLSKGTAYKYMDEARDFIQRFNNSGGFLT